MTKKVGFLHERAVFWKAFRGDHFHTGSLWPSSRYLGRELAVNLRGNRGPGRILEIGAGTGPVTAQILKCLLPGDRFDVVEINGDLVGLLCERFELPGPAPLDSEPQPVRVLHAPIQDVPGEHVYDHVICCLPFNNFPVKLVREIWDNIRRLTAVGGTFVFFEYVAIRDMKLPFVARSEKRRLKLVGRHLNRQIRDSEFRAKTVWMNVPPAVVHHLRFR
jgi:phospholipid N-methyltransferase